MANTKTDVFVTGTFVAVTPVTFTTHGVFAPKTAANPTFTGHALPLIDGRVYLSATGIKGTLRRLASEIVRNGRKFGSLKDYYFTTLGGVYDSRKDEPDDSDAKDGKPKEPKKDTKKTDLSGFSARVRSPLVSLFGSMFPVNLPGRISVSNAISTGMRLNSNGIQEAGTIVPVRVAHVRGDDFRRNGEAFSAVEDEVSDEYTGRKLAATASKALGLNEAKLKSELKTAKLSGDELKIQKAQAALESNQKAATVTSDQQLPTYEVIPAGTLMAVNFRLLNTTDEEVSLFFKSLALWAYRPLFGGRLAHGNGVVGCELQVSTRAAGAHTSAVQAGAFSFNGDFSGPTVATGAVEGWLNNEIDWNAYPLSVDEICADALKSA